MTNGPFNWESRYYYYYYYYLYIYTVKRRRPRFVGGAIEISLIDWLIDWVAGLSTWLRTQKSLTYIVQFRNTQFWWQVLHSGVCSTVMRFNSWNSNCIQSIFCYVVYGSFSYSLVTACKYTWCTFFSYSARTTLLALIDRVLQKKDLHTRCGVLSNIKV